jgi:hypothetical protein
MKKDNSYLLQILSIGKTVLISLSDVANIYDTEHCNHLASMLNLELEKCRKLLEEKESINAPAMAQAFYKVGLLIGISHSQMESVYKYGRDRAAESKGGAVGFFPPHEATILKTLCLRSMKVYRTHRDAIGHIARETKLSMNESTFSKLYRKFLRGDPLWRNSIAVDPAELQEIYRTIYSLS